MNKTAEKINGHEHKWSPLQGGHVQNTKQSETASKSVITYCIYAYTHIYIYIFDLSCIHFKKVLKFVQHYYPIRV